MGSTEEIVCRIAHQIDTGGAVEISKSSCHDRKMSQARPFWTRDGEKVMTQLYHHGKLQPLIMCLYLTTSEQAAQLARVAVLHFFCCHLQTVWSSQEPAHYKGQSLVPSPLMCKRGWKVPWTSLNIAASLKMHTMSDWKGQGSSLTGVDWDGIFLEGWLMLQHGCFHANNKPTTS